MLHHCAGTFLEKRIRCCWNPRQMTRLWMPEGKLIRPTSLFTGFCLNAWKMPATTWISNAHNNRSDKNLYRKRCKWISKTLAREAKKNVKFFELFRWYLTILLQSRHVGTYRSRYRSRNFRIFNVCSTGTTSIWKTKTYKCFSWRIRIVFLMYPSLMPCNAIAQLISSQSSLKEVAFTSNSRIPVGKI